MKSIRIYMLFLCTLLTLPFFAVYSEGTVYVNIEQSKRINTPQWAIDDYNRNDGSGYSWISSNPTALQIRIRNRNYCEVYATSWFPDNESVKLSYKYNIFKYGRLEEVEIIWEVKVEKSSKLTLSASPGSGILTEGTIVKLTAKCDNIDVDADIYYTINGSTPNKDSYKYTPTGIAIYESCELQAIAMKSGYTDSSILKENYYVSSSSVDEPTGNWSESGNYTISWYNKNELEYYISTSKELSGMAYLVNNGYTDFKGKTIKLSSDIDLSGKKWTPCGNFYGTFDGQGHTISGAYIQAVDNCGFWTYTQGTIKNLTLEGQLFGSTSKHYDYGVGIGKAGGFAAECWNCSFENCHSRISFFCSGDFGKIGGVVGSVGNSVKLRHCTFNGNINCDTPHDISIGGLASTANGITLEYCEARIPTVSVATNRGYGVANSSDVLVSGICPSGSSLYCSSCIDKIDVDVKWPTVDEVDINGIGTWQDCINGYSAIWEIETNSAKLTYSGIAYKVNGDNVANFSNNDVKGVSSASKGYNGSTSFSSEQMKGESFLEELNMYSQIELGYGVWSMGINGYPCIASNWNQSSGIQRVSIDRLPSHVFSLFGQRLTVPRKGVNIVGGRKVVMK